MSFILQDIELKEIGPSWNLEEVDTEEFTFLGGQYLNVRPRHNVDEKYEIELKEFEEKEMTRFKRMYQVIQDGDYKKVIDGSIFDLQSGQDKWEFKGCENAGVDADDYPESYTPTFSIEQNTSIQIRTFVSMIQAQCTVYHHRHNYWGYDWRDIWGKEARMMMGDIRLEIYETNEGCDGIGGLSQFIFAIKLNCPSTGFGDKRIWVMPNMESWGSDDDWSHRTYFNPFKLLAIVNEYRISGGY